MEVSSNINAKLTKDLFDKDETIGIFEDPINQNRRLSTFEPSLSNLPTGKRANAQGDNGDAYSKVKREATKLSRKAFLEVPLAISEEKGIKVAPNARMSMSSTFPIMASKQWSGRLNASAVIRGYTGYTTQDASIKYDINKKIAVQTGLSAIRNRYNIYVDARTAVGNTGSLSARYSQMPTTLGIRGARASVTGSQSYSFGTISSTCMLPLSTTTTTPLTFSLGMASKTVHPWRINVGWNQLHSFTWQWHASPKISDYQTLRVAIGQIRHGIWTLSGSFIQKIREKMTFGVAVSHNGSQGTMWILQWTNGDFSLNVPISFLDFQDMWASFALVGLTKLVQDAVAMTLRLDKVATESLVLERKQAQEKRTSARQEATNQQELMRRQARTRSNSEKESNGLIIQSATCFLAESTNPTVSLDVTIPLQFWVSDGMLELPVGSKKNLLGFFDIAANHDKAKKADLETESIFSTKWWSGFARKQKRVTRAKAMRPRLRVVYEFKGRRDEVLIDDEDKLVLPR